MSLMDGQPYDEYCETYITPDLYWEGALGLTMTRSVLNTFDVNVSMWTWCLTAGLLYPGRSSGVSQQYGSIGK